MLHLLKSKAMVLMCLGGERRAWEWFLLFFASYLLSYYCELCFIFLSFFLFWFFYSHFIFPREPRAHYWSLDVRICIRLGSPLLPCPEGCIIPFPSPHGGWFLLLPPLHPVEYPATSRRALEPSFRPAFCLRRRPGPHRHFSFLCLFLFYRPAK